LLLVCGPTDVAWLVVTVDIDAINGMIITWLSADIGKEVNK
jgi:hypothetical protein